MASGTVHKQFTRQEILDMIYPIGAVYISTSNTSPATLFGGSWTKISGRFLLSTGNCSANSDNYFGTIKSTSWSAGLKSTGGEDYHTLSVSEIPSHTHGITNGTMSWPKDGTAAEHGPNNWGTVVWPKVVGVWATDARGGGAQHNNMPPYFTVNMWYRTA